MGRSRRCRVALLAICVLALCLLPTRAWAATTVPIYRMYNTRTSEHLYTRSKTEYLSCGRGAYFDWRQEGIAWEAPSTPSVPVYRLYNARSGDHHYTTSTGERDLLVARHGWRSEGVAFYSARKGETGAIPLYRLYNPGLRRGQHHYTANAAERDLLVARHGWRSEGIGWYGFKATQTTPAPASPSANGALRVSGSQLVDARGNPVQLRGVSTHGLAWFPAYVNNACFGQLRRDWGANVVRLALYTQEYGGYCSGGDQAALRDLVRRGVRYATDNDLYVIVDWHILSDGNPLTHVGEAKAFFSEMSRSFADQSNVLYEICNEPNGATSWADIKRYAEQVIPVIRANDLDAVVLVGTPTWSQEVDKAAADPLLFGNVMYTLHFYAATHKDDLRSRLAQALRAGLPVFVSEFGICDASGNGAIDEASANAWMTLLADHQVSWCMWSLCNKAESASALRSDCTKTSGFVQGDLTQAGRWLVGVLKGGPLAGESPTDTGQSDAPSQPSSPAQTSWAFTSGGMTCTATLVASWDAGAGKMCYQYSLSLENAGSDCDSWRVEVPFDQKIELVNGWNGSFSAEGKRLVVANASYNGSISAGSKVSDIGFQVTAGPGLAIG